MWEQDGSQQVFYYRVAGVAVTDRHVLLHRSEIDDFWALPGGRVEFGEAAEQALAREMQEEIGAQVSTGPLLWVAENFFTYQQYQVHELGLYFQMHLPDEPRLQAGRFTGQESDQSVGPPVFKLYFQWFPRRAEVLRALPLLPDFLARGLVQLPETPVHIVNDER